MIEVTCPHCQHKQREAEGAISTYCRACAHYFLIGEKPKRAVVRLPKQTRVARCFHCRRDNRIAPSALSSQCPHCSAYIDLRDHKISGTSTEALQTHGALHFLPGCHHHGFLVEASRVTIAGLVEAPVAALEELTFERQGILRGAAETSRLQVAAQSQARASEIVAEVVEIYGQLEMRRLEVRKQLHVYAGGRIRAEVLVVPTAIVEFGAELVGEFSTNVPAPLERTFGAFAQRPSKTTVAIPKPSSSS